MGGKIAFASLLVAATCACASAQSPAYQAIRSHLEAVQALFEPTRVATANAPTTSLARFQSLTECTPFVVENCVCPNGKCPGTSGCKGVSLYDGAQHEKDWNWQTFAVGQYDKQTMERMGFGNNDLSSLTVPPGCKATMWDDDKFGHGVLRAAGERPTVFTANGGADGKYDKAALQHMGKLQGFGNNDLSSFKVEWDRTTDPAFMAAEQRKEAEKKKAQCGEPTVRGEWKKRRYTNAGSHKYTYQEGISTTDSDSRTEAWKKSVSAGVSAGFTFMGAGATASVSGTSAKSGAATVSQAIHKTSSQVQETTFSTPGTVWQFSYVATDKCTPTSGEIEIKTQDLVVSSGQPCCMPQSAMDENNQHGPCQPGTPCSCPDEICDRPAGGYAECEQAIKYFKLYSAGGQAEYKAVELLLKTCSDLKAGELHKKLAA